MKVVIYRPEPTEYELPLEDVTVLEVLKYLKEKVDATLGFSYSCESIVCGSCAVLCNDKEVLACSHKASDGMELKPLKYFKPLKDLIVDATPVIEDNRRSQAWLDAKEPKAMSIENEKQVELQSSCILCGACYSVCPVLEVNPNFLAPFAQSRTWRYVNDVRDDNAKAKVQSVQTNGIWDCTLCNECYVVCPQKISPKQDIFMLRNKSGVMGFSDPKFAGGFNAGGFGMPDFGGPSF